MAKTETSDFWRRLAEAMSDAKMKPTQKRAGALIGVSQSAASGWKTGSALPSMENATMLAIKLGVSTEWLLTGRGPKAIADNDRIIEAARIIEPWLAASNLPISDADVHTL